MFNWLSQVASISYFNLRTIPERKGAAIATAVGIAGVVGVFVGVFSIAEGFRRAMTVSGSPDVAVVLRSGADSEMTSGITRDDTRVIHDAPGVARVGNDPLVSAELFVMIDLPKRSTGTDANVPLRGVGPMAMPVRGNIKLVEGRAFEFGRNEVIVGVGAAREFAGLEVGKKIRVGQNDWNVVGIFSADGGVAESEIWTDAAVLQPAYHQGDNFQSAYAKLTSPEAFAKFSSALTADPRLQVKVVRQTDFYAQQSTQVTAFIRGIGFFIAGMMALGALFGALNTMYSAVATRTREIATLRVLGFGAGPVVVSVMVESLVLALLGGAVGATIATLVFNGFHAATINWQTFSQVAFSFTVTPAILIGAVAWSAGIGLLGGLFPAIRAARLPLAAALREV